MSLNTDRRRSRRRSGLARTLAVAVVAVVVAALAWWVFLGPPASAPAPSFSNPQAPEGLADLALGGVDGPFYPSAAAIRDGHIVESWAGAASGCGASGCHGDIVAQWQGSPHRFAGFENPWYQASYALAHEQIGEPAVRWCAGCHSPAILLSGQVEATPTPPDPGVDCLACHAMQRAESSLGQGDYELGLPALQSLAASSNGLLRGLHRLLVRLNPQPHSRAYRGSVVIGAASPEACSTCHRGHLDEAVGGDRFRPLFDDYRPWAEGPSSGRSTFPVRHSEPTASCVDCHMPKVTTAEGELASHHFAAAHTALAAWRGDDEQLDRIAEFMDTSDITLDFFAMTEPTELGGVLEPMPVDQAETIYAPLDRIPATLRRGESRRVDLVVNVRGSGHLFPGGKGDLAECWLETRAVDETGQVLFHSGHAEAGEPVDAEAKRFDVLFIDAEGRRLRHYEPWNVRGQVYDLRLNPNGPQRVRFRLDVPVTAGDRLTLTTALRYRSLPAAFNAWAFERLGTEPPELPVLTLAETSFTFAVIDSGEPLPEMGAPDSRPAIDADRWFNYGAALSDQYAHADSRRAFQHAIDLDPNHARAHLERALVIPGIDGPMSHLWRSLDLDPKLGRARYYVGYIQRLEGKNEQSIATFEALAADEPRDPEVRREFANTLYTVGRFEPAIEQYRAVLEIEPFDAEAHRSLSRAYRATGESELAERHLTLADRFAEDDATLERIESYLETDPLAQRSNEDNPEYVSSPIVAGGGAGQ